jgi:hypothetical protein
MRTLLVAVSLLLTGCPTESEYVEPPSGADFTLFPAVLGSSRLFAESGEARLEFDPTTKDAITALGLCVDAATYCYAPGTKELAWCLEHTRTCSTDQPWTETPCCPQACKAAFSARLDAGVPQSAALEQVFFVDRKCFPGLAAVLEGSP